MSDKPKELEIPDDVVESFARCIFPAIKEYFESEQGQMEFERWKADRGNLIKNLTSKSTIVE